MMIAFNPISFGGSVKHMERIFLEAHGDHARLPGERRQQNRRRAEAEGLAVQEAWFPI